MRDMEGKDSLFYFWEDWVMVLGLHFTPLFVISSIVAAAIGSWGSEGKRDKQKIKQTFKKTNETNRKRREAQGGGGMRITRSK